MVSKCLTLQVTANRIPEELHHFAFLPAMQENASCSNICWHFKLQVLLNLGHSGKKVVMYHCNFSLHLLHFPDDRWCCPCFHMLINYWHIFLSEVSVQVLGPFKTKSCLTELWELPLPSRYKPFVRFAYARYSLPGAWPLLFLICFLWGNANFGWSPLYPLLKGFLCSMKSLTALWLENILLCFLPGASQISFFFF